MRETVGEGMKGWWWDMEGRGGGGVVKEEG